MKNKKLLITRTNRLNTTIGHTILKTEQVILRKEEWIKTNIPLINYTTKGVLGRMGGGKGNIKYKYRIYKRDSNIIRIPYLTYGKKIRRIIDRISKITNIVTQGKRYNLEGNNINEKIKKNK